MNDENLKLVVEGDASKYTLPTRGVMVDVVRCQAALPNNLDLMRLTCTGSVRCEAAPVSVLVAKAPAHDSRVSAISVCLACHHRAADRVAERSVPPAFAYNIYSWIRWVLTQGRQDVLTEDGIEQVSPQYVVGKLGINIPSVDGAVLIPRCLFPGSGFLTEDPKLVSLAAAMRALGLFPWAANMVGGVLSMQRETKAAP